MPEKRLPIKVVIPREDDFFRHIAGGGPRKRFGEVTADVRTGIVTQLDKVESYFAPQFDGDPEVPAVAKLTLKRDALAKSHRPTDLFSDSTCPVIGAGSFGSLYLSVLPKGLERLRKRISTTQSQSGIASISAIEEVVPYRAEDALSYLSDPEIGNSTPLKLKVFIHHKSRMDNAISGKLEDLLSEFKDPIAEPLRYGPRLKVYRLSRLSAEAVKVLGAFVGTQSISTFPFYRSVKTEAVPMRRAQLEDFPPPLQDRRYPIVGIIDSGVNPNDDLLNAWCAGREAFVPHNRSDFDHGTFVAGLIANAHRLNHQDHRFPLAGSRFVDIAALPGRNDFLREDQLLAILDEVVPKYPDIKVWNLSLSSQGAPCSDDAFSDFAVALDEMQSRFDVTFVIAAGNFFSPPFRTWPPDIDHREEDRILPPADSVRGVTVGSLAHLDSARSRARREDPSPFSRRGPGASFLPKPEVSHYGGNCDDRGNYDQIGVLSIDGSKNLAENVGTSFATPSVSNILSHITDGLIAPSRILSKALLIHSAVTAAGKVDPETLRYKGFGTPSDLETILTCSNWAATLIFEPSVIPGIDFVKDHFPMPNVLRDVNGSFRGEITITLVYDPPLDSTYGAEYCRRNIEVSLGTYGPDKEGNMTHTRKVPPEPRDLARLYERELVEHGFKWSPLKVYHRKMPRGVAGENWRLVVSAHDRSGFVDEERTPVALLITIADLQKKAPVYDELVARMNLGGWVTQDLELREEVRVRAQL